MSNYLVSTFAKRLQEALDIRGITPAELSKRTGINEGTLSNYRKGKYKPKQDKLELISTALNVSAGWLLGADVPMIGNSYQNNTMSYHSDHLSSHEVEHIKKYRRLSQQGKQTVDTLVDNLLLMNGAEPQEKEQPQAALENA